MTQEQLQATIDALRRENNDIRDKFATVLKAWGDDKARIAEMEAALTMVINNIQYERAHTDDELCRKVGDVLAGQPLRDVPPQPGQGAEGAA